MPARSRAMKSWTSTCSGSPGRAPLAAAVLVLADQFLLLGVHADHRLPGGQVRADLLVEVAELGVAVGVLAALDGLGVGLQAEALLVQQVGHRVGADPVPLRGSAPSASCPGRLRRPPQRRHRVPPRVGLDQRQQRRRAAPDPARSTACGRARAARTRPDGSAPASSSARPARDRPLPHPGRLGDRPDPAMAPAPAPPPGQQPPLPLVQMRADLLEYRRHPAPLNIHTAL